MAGLNNLSRGDFDGILKRLRALETASPLRNASIGAGGLRVHSGGVINIENGGLQVSGSATIIGTLNADGTINMTGMFIASGEVRLNGNTIASGDFSISGLLLVDGNTTFNGELDINGPTTINGDTTVTGDLDVKGPLDVAGTMDIKGKSTLQNDLTVQAGGRIKVGANMTLNPSRNGGSVEFNNGTEISSTGPELTLKASNAGVFLQTSTALITGGSSTLVMVGSSTNVSTPLFMVSDRMLAQGLRAAPAGAKANLYCDPSTGEFMRIA